MKPEVWVPSLAALLASLLPLIVKGITDRRKNKALSGHGTRLSTPLRILWITAVFTAAAVALLALSATGTWRWILVGGYPAALAAAYALVRWNGRRRPQLSPEAEQFVRYRAGRDAGYPYDRDFLPDLVRVYTENDLTGGEQSTPTRTQANSEPPKEPVAEQRVTFEKVLTDPKVRHVAITGEAGIGKTSLLEFWSHELRLKRPSAGDRLSRFRPLLIAARTLVGRHSVAEGFGESGPALLTKPPGQGMTWLVMIDAFDEITDAEARADVERIVFEAIDEAAAAPESCKFVITTRGLTDDRRRSFDSRGVSEYTLQPFTPDQLREFLIAEETSVRDREARNERYEAAVAKVDRFLKRWEGHDDLLELIRLPLLARVTATIYFQDRQLDIPARRIDIYQDAIEHWIAQFHKRMSEERNRLGPALKLLHDWHSSVGGPNPPDTDLAVRDLLCRLAASYLESGQRSVVGIACDLLAVPMRPKDPVRLQALLTLLEATGLVHDVKAIDPRFVHKSFAEYLAVPAQLAQYATVEDWTTAFRDPDRRISAIFAFAHLSVERQRALTTSMESDEDHVIALGWIAAEGLCTLPGSGSIDEERRNALVQRCIRMMPPHPSDEWWQLIGGLASVESARDLLLAVVDERRISDWTLQRICRELAKHDERGVERLRRMATDASMNWFMRVNAADDLAEYDREAGVMMLRRCAESSGLPSGASVSAGRYLSKYLPEIGVPLLREFAEGDAFDRYSRIAAAGALAEHDRATAVRLLQEITVEHAADHNQRVSAARELVDLGIESAVDLLKRYAEDSTMDGHVRVSAASTLVAIDRERGLAVIRSLATDVYVAAHERVSASLSLMTHEPDTGMRMLREFTEETSIDDLDRASSARSLRTDDPRFSASALERFARDTATEGTARSMVIDDMVEVDRREWLPKLQDLVSAPEIDDVDKVNAAMWLQTRDAGAGAAALEHLSNDLALNDFARAYAISCRADVGDPVGAGRLNELAGDPRVDAHARILAARWLAGFKPSTYIERLRELVGDAALDGDARVEVLVSLVARDHQADPMALFECAQDARLSGSARVRAARALAQYRRSEAITTLESLVHDPDVRDQDRVDAAEHLARFDGSTASRRMLEFAGDADFDDHARLSAAKLLTRWDLARGAPQLLALANDRSLIDSVPVDAACWLTRHGNDDGRRLLVAFAEGAALDDQGKVDAAEHLVRFERTRALTFLKRFATGLGCDEHAQVAAAVTLTRHDRESGLPLLRALVEERSPGRMRRALALALEHWSRYEPETGADTLRCLAVDPAFPDAARIHAAQSLVRYDREEGHLLLRRFAASEEMSAHCRTVAARSLTEHDRVLGLKLLRAFADDQELEGVARASAADALTGHVRHEGMERLRRLSEDTSLDGMARVNAARWLTYEMKAEGLALLHGFAQDSDLSDTARCWASIALADRDPAVRDSLVATQAGNPDIDHAVLRDAADALIELHPRLGYRTSRRVAAITAVNTQARTVNP